MLLALGVASCGGGAASGYRACLSRLGQLTSKYGEDVVRFPDGTKVFVVVTPTPGDAQQLAPLAGGPGDPYGYTAFGRAVIGWAGSARDPHLLAVERCLRQE